MKNLLLAFIAVAFFALDSNAQAENYKSFEWDIIRLGFATPSGEGVTGGVAMGSEFRYNVKDNISAALRLEFALFGSDSDVVSLGAFGSYSLIGDYYFSNTGNSRAFAGAGLGLFNGGSVEVNGQAVDGGGGSDFGAVARVGYELGLLRLSGEYNLIFAEGASNYIGVHVGITLFGGYKGS